MRVIRLICCVVVVLLLQYAEGAPILLAALAHRKGAA